MFHIDQRIASTTSTLADWPLSRVLLKNEQDYPWFILVPRRPDIQEIFQLNESDQRVLMQEINHLSLIINDYYKPDKLNIGSLGNIVPQLHMHLIARTKQDKLWPQGIWQAAFSSNPYTEREFDRVSREFKNLIDEMGLHKKPLESP